MKTTPEDPQRWRKSSYSGGSGDGSCVEVSWRKSSYSGGGDGSCVEVVFGAEVIGVRDSKNVAGPRLAFEEAAWRAFVERC